MHCSLIMVVFNEGGNMKKLDQYMTVRFDVALKNALKKEAEIQRQSLNSFILTALEWYIADKKKSRKEG